MLQTEIEYQSGIIDGMLLFIERTEVGRELEEYIKKSNFINSIETLNNIREICKKHNYNLEENYEEYILVALSLKNPELSQSLEYQEYNGKYKSAYNNIASRHKVNRHFHISVSSKVIIVNVLLVAIIATIGFLIDKPRILEPYRLVQSIEQVDENNTIEEFNQQKVKAINASMVFINKEGYRYLHNNNVMTDGVYEKYITFGENTKDKIIDGVMIKDSGRNIFISKTIFNERLLNEQEILMKYIKMKDVSVFPFFTFLFIILYAWVSVIFYSRGILYKYRNTEIEHFI